MLYDHLSYQLAVFNSDLTSVLSIASRARLLKGPLCYGVEDWSCFKQEKLLSTPADGAQIVATNENSL